MSMEIVIEAKPKVKGSDRKGHSKKDRDSKRERECDADNAMKLPRNQVVNQVAQRAASA